MNKLIAFIQLVCGLLSMMASGIMTIAGATVHHSALETIVFAAIFVMMASSVVGIYREWSQESN